jgi:hypothetical protein
VLLTTGGLIMFTRRCFRVVCLSSLICIASGSVIAVPFKKVYTGSWDNQHQDWSANNGQGNAVLGAIGCFFSGTCGVGAVVESAPEKKFDKELRDEICAMRSTYRSTYHTHATC